MENDIKQVADMIRGLAGPGAPDWAVLAFTGLALLWAAAGLARTGWTAGGWAVRKARPAPGEVCAKALEMIQALPLVATTSNLPGSAVPLTHLRFGTLEVCPENELVAMHGSSIGRHMSRRDRKRVLAAALSSKREADEAQSEQDRLELVWQMEAATAAASKAGN